MNLAEKIKHVRERRLYAQRMVRACDWLEARYLQQAEVAALTPTEAGARLGLTMFSARTLVARVRRLAGYAVLLGLFAVGCKTSESKTSHQVPLPPMPRATRGGAGGEVGHVARAVSAPVGPPAPRWFSWVNWPGARIAVIEKSTDMVNWSQIGRVTNQTHFLVSVDGPHGYFRVGHPANETHHWFDPVLEIYKCDLPE